MSQTTPELRRPTTILGTCLGVFVFALAGCSSFFGPFDSVVVTDVFHTGNYYFVEGEYDLRSRDEARLGLVVANSGMPHASDFQAMPVARGSGRFLLAMTVPPSGTLQLKLFPAEGGETFYNYDIPPSILDASPEPPATPFEVGAQKFADGDSITIREVVATSPRMDVGDTVLVLGRYVLSSRERANLGLSLTQTEHPHPTSASSAANTTIEKGAGDFELRFEVRDIGCLHLSFGSLPERKSFGTVYFGTAEQLKRVRGMNRRIDIWTMPETKQRPDGTPAERPGMAPDASSDNP